MDTYIRIITGRLGGGKSYYATRMALEHMRRGGLVVTNMQFELEPWYDADRDFQGCGVKRALKLLYNYEYQEGQLVHLQAAQDNDRDYSDVVRNTHRYVPVGKPDLPVLLILDEVLDLFNSRGGNVGIDEFMKWLRHSRKVRCSVVMIAQKFGRLKKEIRELADYIYDVTNCEKVRVPILKIPHPFPWCFRIRELDADGELVKAWYESKRDVIYGSYRTDQVFVDILAGVDAEKETTDFRKTEKRGKKMNYRQAALLYITTGVCAILLIRGAWRGGNDVSEEQIQKVINGMDLTIDRERVVDSVEYTTGENVSREYRRFDYVGGTGRKKEVSIDGRRYYKGRPVPEGIVQYVSSTMVSIKARDGKKSVIYINGRPDGEEGKKTSANKTRKESNRKGVLNQI
jgi:hypothetical protein